jgi:DNA-binding CsgD family transcriptional regulator
MSDTRRIGARGIDYCSNTSERERSYANKAPALSPREVEVLTWLAQGKSGPEIAIILGISTCTVRLHIQSTKRKLNAANIPHAVSQGFALGILHSTTG